MTGMVSYLSGFAAEESVARVYRHAGYCISARRWRGTRGELDIVASRGEEVIFVEVKKSKSYDAAIRRISKAQISRIFSTATEFVANSPNGQLTPMRFDLALVDGHGQTKIIENAFV